MAITNEALDRLLTLSHACDPPPWQSVLEGRDQDSGDSFIQTGSGATRGEDIYITRESGPAGANYLDLIAMMRTLLPEIVTELRSIRGETDPT